MSILRRYDKEDWAIRKDEEKGVWLAVCASSCNGNHIELDGTLNTLQVERMLDLIMAQRLMSFESGRNAGFEEGYSHLASALRTVDRATKFGRYTND